MRADGYAEATTRLAGIMADGKDRDVEYMRGVEAVLASTLMRVREAIGHAETMKRIPGEDSG